MSGDKKSKHAWRHWAVYGALLVAAVPWYWPADNLVTVLGFPGWTISAIVVSFFASVYTAAVLASPWIDEKSESPSPSEPNP